MKRFWVCIVVLGLGMGMARLLRADSGAIIAAPNMRDMNEMVWYIQQEANIAKDPEAMGVYAVNKECELIQDQPAETQTDELQKMLFDSRNHAVQREIRMKLVDMYKANGRIDKAKEQIQALVTEAP